MCRWCGKCSVNQTRKSPPSASTDRFGGFSCGPTAVLLLPHLSPQLTLHNKWLSIWVDTVIMMSWKCPATWNGITVSQILRLKTEEGMMQNYVQILSVSVRLYNMYLCDLSCWYKRSIASKKSFVNIAYGVRASPLSPILISLCISALRHCFNVPVGVKVFVLF